MNMKKILIIDNYDSFTYNLKQLIDTHFDGVSTVKRNDEIGSSYIEENEFNAIVISPGPKKPADSGISKDTISKFHKRIPILGVCLGMQCINEVFEGRTIKAPIPIHGKSSEISHNNSKLFKNIPKKFKVARYHSLIIEPASEDLLITAYTSDKIPMAIEHKSFPLFGVQFHPESFMTEYGNDIMSNFLEFIK